MEGERIGPARRYTGLFLTHPATFDVASPADGVTTMVSGTGTDVPPTVDHSVDPPRLRSMRGRLWETLFLRDDRLQDLGGGVQLSRDDRLLTYVDNHTSYTLRGAIVIDGTGGVYRVGDVPPGGRARIARSQSHTIAMPTSYFSLTEADPQWALLAHDFGMSEDEKKVLMGLSGLLNGSLVTAQEPTLYARLDSGRRPADIADFGVDRDVTFVRVVPRLPDETVYRAPPATNPQNGTMPIPEPEVDDEQSSDGGVSDGAAGDAALVDPALGVDPFPAPATPPPVTSGSPPIGEDL